MRAGLLSKNLPNAKLVNAAVWSSSRSLSLESDRSDHYSAMVVSNEAGDVQGLTITEVLALSAERIDLLKIDIEGAEVELFKGNTDWLNRVQCIAIEFHGDSRRESRFDELMKFYGFQIHEGKHTVIAVKS